MKTIIQKKTERSAFKPKIGATEGSTDDFMARWEQFDKELPDVELSEEEIMSEIRTVRYAKNK